MDEMNAFERQLAAELGQMAGPGRHIDGMAMARTASGRSSSRRLRSVFGATKLGVAAAVVAVFGGLLLAGMLTQPSGERPPPVGASPSPEQSASADPLQGAVTEEVGPGVVRVVADAVENDLTGVEQVAIAADGTVWVTSGPFYGRLGQDELGILTLPGGDAEPDWQLTVGADGVPIAYERGFAGGIARLGDDRWQPYPTDRWEAVLAATTTTTGDLWVSAGGTIGTDGEFAVGRYDGDSWTWYDRADLGVYEGWVDDFAETPDGGIWVGVDNYGGPAQGGLSRFDGSAWHPIDPFESDGRFAAGDLEVASDGTLWAGMLRIDADGRELYLGHWDGSGWTVRPRDGAWVVPNASPDGDQEAWPVAVVHPNDLGLGEPLEIARTPDGRLWWTTETGLYVMDPEEVEAAE